MIWHVLVWFSDLCIRAIIRTVMNVNYKDTSDVCLYINVSLNWDCCKLILIWISRLDVQKSRIKLDRNVKFVVMLNLISYICLRIWFRSTRLEIIHYEFSVKQPMSQWYIYIWLNTVEIGPTAYLSLKV